VLPHPSQHPLRLSPDEARARREFVLVLLDVLSTSVVEADFDAVEVRARRSSLVVRILLPGIDQVGLGGQPLPDEIDEPVILKVGRCALEVVSYRELASSSVARDVAECLDPPRRGTHDNRLAQVATDRQLRAGSASVGSDLEVAPVGDR
jgi:hypothetical protein